MRAKQVGAVLVLLALAGLAVWVFKVTATPVRITQTRINEYQCKLEGFRRRSGAYPTTEQGLNALGNPVAMDGFGNAFVYEGGPASFRLKSLGRDRKPGGAGEDFDYGVDRSEVPSVSLLGGRILFWEGGVLLCLDG